MTLVQAEVPRPELNRFLYTTVGAPWSWYARLTWSYDDWMRWLELPEVETWVGYVRGTPAGYFELERQAEGSVEVAYFGLRPASSVGGSAAGS